MDTTDIGFATAVDLADAVRRRDVSVGDVADVMLERVERINPQINAIIHHDPAQVRRDAERLDRARDGGEALGPLHGVPFTIKDLTAVDGLPLTFGMIPMKDQIADHDAVIVRRLREAGGLFLGKTNTPESGYYGGTDNHLFGPTHNPWKHGHTAGGSSGGASAAVASGLGPIAEGSDGAGSVRIPSAMCGVVGLKPSTGRVPQNILAGRYYEWCYHGPITRTVADSALMMDVIVGPDPSDAMSYPSPQGGYLEALKDLDITGLKVAWSPDLGLGHVDPEVVSVCRDAVDALAARGAHVEEATPQWGDPEQAMWHGIWVPGFASEHDLVDWDRWAGQVDDRLVEIMRQSERITAYDIAQADLFRGRMWDTFTAFMQRYDVLVSPTLASATFPLERFAPSWLEGESLQRELLGWLLTYPFNMMTTPAITVPAGFTSDTRPVGLQIAGGLHADHLVMRVAGALEAERPWADRFPEVAR